MSLGLGRPSVGFVGVCLSYALVAAFVLWGFSTPDLDRVWTLHHLLKTGQQWELDRGDRELLGRAMARHPELGRDLIDRAEIGIISAHDEQWIATPTVTIVRTAESERFRVIKVDVQTPQDLLPIAIIAKGKGWRHEQLVERQQPIRIELPPPPETAELIELELRGQGVEADPSVLAMRLSFPEAS